MEQCKGPLQGTRCIVNHYVMIVLSIPQLSKRACGMTIIWCYPCNVLLREQGLRIDTSGLPPL